MATLGNLPLQDLLPMELPLTPFAAGSHARTLAPLEKRLASRVSAAAFGVNTPVSLANYDPASCSWKTSQRCLVGGWTVFSETWPRSGMMRSGTAYQLPPLALPTIGTASGLLATPTKTANQDAPSMMKHKGCRNLRLLRTPNAGNEKWRFSWQELGGSSNPYRGTDFGRQKIHPWEWEWMMGFPADWTDLEPLETP